MSDLARKTRQKANHAVLTDEKTFAGAAGGTKVWHCALHKVKGSKNVRATLCHYAMGCSRVASFGDPLAGSTLFCSVHKASECFDASNLLLLFALFMPCNCRQRGMSTDMSRAPVPLTGPGVCTLAGSHINLRQLRTDGKKGKHVATSKEKSRKKVSESVDGRLP